MNRNKLTFYDLYSVYQRFSNGNECSLNYLGFNFRTIYRHGEKWDTFRAQVQHVMLQPSTARKYLMPLNDIANDFMDRYGPAKQDFMDIL